MVDLYELIPINTEGYFFYWFGILKEIFIVYKFENHYRKKNLNLFY